MLDRLQRIVILASVAGVSAAGASEEAPDWLREAFTRKVPAYEAKVPGVVLLRETSTSVDETGRLVTSTREALRVLSREGRADAYASQIYETGNSKVRDMKAWMLAPSGELLKLPKEANYDKAYTTNNAYDDIRVRGIDGRSKADPGSVFGFEIVTQDRALFSQFEWDLQNRLPVLLSRRVLKLPTGWRADSVTFNQPELKPSVEGSTYTWEARDLPFVEPEPNSPRLFSLVPRVAITYFPPAGAKSSSAPAFASWQDVSRWVTAATEAQAQPSDAIVAKAKALTANAKTEFERIQAIGWFVQGVKYVSIQIGVGRGGGYRPKPADDVLVKEYGDCKDKATLMRALLKALGISSYLVAIYSGDRSYVQEGWPSPQQFNHAIVAVRVSDDTRAGAVIQHPVLGRLLLFDPTNGATPVGDLPNYEQGSPALIAADGQGDLIHTPETPPSANLSTREIQAILDPSGKLTARLSELFSGQSAASERAVYNDRSLPDFKKSIENWISLTATGALISKVQPSDAFLQGRFRLEAEFEAPGYAQIRANRLMIFKPAIVGRRQSVFLTEPKRSYPVLLNAVAFNEKVRVQLPQGFKVDELPDPEKFETPFGKYVSSCEVSGGELVFARTLQIRSATIPVAQYQAVRQFFEHILNIEQTPVVLLRQ
ncbi:MAG TPA: transglutaminase family protein [Bryobacteraceae bacterium]|nr:transglutaminase family protein [Bryobacteraceae bacterium]